MGRDFTTLGSEPEKMIVPCSKSEPMKRSDAEFCELSLKIIFLLESYNIRVYDSEYVDELIEKTLERDEKECSH